MGKYRSSVRQKSLPRDRGVHPVMRGIGCIMMVVVPILAYGLSVLLVNYGARNAWPIPPDWLGMPQFPPLLKSISGLAAAIRFLETIPNLTANLVFTVAITIVTGGIMSILFGYIYQIFGPSRYGPTDVPPPRVKTKTYKR